MTIYQYLSTRTRRQHDNIILTIDLTFIITFWLTLSLRTLLQVIDLAAQNGNTRIVTSNAWNHNNYLTMYIHFVGIGYHCYMHKLLHNMTLITMSI